MGLVCMEDIAANEMAILLHNNIKIINNNYYIG